MSEKILYCCKTTGVEWEATIRWSGTHSKATHLDPEEWPTPEIDRAWRNGVAMSDPTLVPEDVADEILHRAVDPKWPRVLPCGCCTNGCVCFDHRETRSGPTITGGKCPAHGGAA